MTEHIYARYYHIFQFGEQDWRIVRGMTTRPEVFKDAMDAKDAIRAECVADGVGSDVHIRVH